MEEFDRFIDSIHSFIATLEEEFHFLQFIEDSIDEFEVFIDSTGDRLLNVLIPIENQNQTPQPANDREANSQDIFTSEAEDVLPKTYILEREIESECACKNLAEIYAIMADYRKYILTIAERKHYWNLAALELERDLAKFKTMNAHLDLYRDIAERQRQDIVRSRTLWQEELNLARATLNESAIDKALQWIDTYHKLELDIERVKNTISSQLDTLQETRTTVENIQPLISRQGEAIKHSYQLLARKIHTDLVAEGVRDKYIDIN